MKQTTPKQRKQFYELHQQGHSYPKIASQFGVSRECVRYWCRRQRDGGSAHNAYQRDPPGLLSRFDAKVRFAILRFRLDQPGWGPRSILFHLHKRPSLKGLRLPSRASIGRYLHQWKRFRRQTQELKVNERPDQPTEVHQRWQIDFKLDIEIAAGERVNLHTVRDPVGEAVIGAQVFAVPATARLARVRMENVRACLRACFQHWGTLPKEVQTDGEAVLIGKPNDSFPSRFSLWLVGLGIQHLIIRAGKPTDNAEVERCHGTINQYAIVGNEDKSRDELQDILKTATYESNYELSSQAEGCAGRTPIQAHPELLEQKRPYQADRELLHFDLQRVDQFLASFVWDRKVSKNGVIYLIDRYSLGRKYAGQQVKVRFDPQDRHFVCFQLGSDEQELELRRWPARNLEVADIIGLMQSPWPFGPGPQQLRLPLPAFECPWPKRSHPQQLRLPLEEFKGVTFQ